MKRKKDEVNLSAQKKDSVGLFSGKFKPQTFKDKKDKLEQEEIKSKQKNYTEDT